MGDVQPVKWEEEELHEASEELGPATGQYPTELTFRDSLRKLYSSDRFQVIHNMITVSSSTFCSNLCCVNNVLLLPFLNVFLLFAHDPHNASETGGS